MSLYAIWDKLFSFLVKVNQNLKFLHWASILIGNLQRIPASFKWESPWATCPDHCYKVPESHEAVGCPGHCSFSCETGCPDHCCSLPTVSTLLICPSECHTSCYELCPMHCCKVSSFSVSLCPSHCKTACDHLCPSHCCSQQLTPAAVLMQLGPFKRGKIRCELHHLLEQNSSYKWFTSYFCS